MPIVIKEMVVKATVEEKQNLSEFDVEKLVQTIKNRVIEELKEDGFDDLSSKFRKR